MQSWEEYVEMEERVNTPPKLAQVVCFDPDEADGYAGNAEDGVYWQVDHLSQKELDGADESDWQPGWYMTAVVDCDSAGFVDTLAQDAGPFDTEDQAKDAGKAAALEWCAANQVNHEEEE